jgi:hypothetical protein
LGGAVRGGFGVGWWFDARCRLAKDFVGARTEQQHHTHKNATAMHGYAQHSSNTAQCSGWHCGGEDVLWVHVRSSLSSWREWIGGIMFRN